jgi:uncharacterized protein (TIGR03435 family)
MIPESLSPIANHLWQSTLFGGLAGLLTLALRKNPARLRHWVWAAASLKFLVPFSVLVGLGSQVHRQSVTNSATSNIATVMDQISQPFTAPLEVARSLPTKPSSPNGIPFALGTLWTIGFTWVAASWLIRWRRIHATVRAGTPVEVDFPTPVISSPSFLEPGVFGIFRPVLLVPEGLSEHLTPEQWESVVAHELCHLRSRDNLIGFMQTFVEAVFWFHPLVRWIGKRIYLEREMACDEEVLRLGSEPRVYAEGILKVCELYLESPVACMAGVAGSSLSRRIEGIMSKRILRKLSLPGKVILASVCMAVVSGPLVIGMLKAQSVTPSPPSFEVASVKVSTTQENPRAQRWGPQTVDLVRANLLATIADAYQIPYTRIVTPQDSASQKVLGANYDITAKADHASPKSELLLMSQRLFEDRFHLRVHKESKTVDVYKLVIAKGGPKLEESTTTDGRASGNLIDGGLVSKNIELWRFCAILSGRMGRPVVDETRLTGIYNFTLKLDVFEGVSSLDPDLKTKMADWSSSSIFSDIQRQLGLQLVPSKAPVDYLVIDHVEQPSEN